MAKTKKSAVAAVPDTSYNGWKNYETWAVALWIDNDEATYNHARFMARECAEQAKEELEEKKGDLRARTADGLLADRLKEWAEEQMPELGASMWADLLNAAFGEVDWYEIAHNMHSD